MYYILSVGGMVIVRYLEFIGCLLLGGSLSINAMLNSILAMGLVHYIEFGRSSEGLLWKVPLYSKKHQCCCILKMFHCVHIMYNTVEM